MDDHVRTNKTPWALLALIGIVIVGAALRWMNIGREALWVDEALTFIVARHEISRLFLEPIDPSGPIYYVAHKLLVGEVASAVEARMVSFVAGVALIPVVYALACQVMAVRSGLVAAAMVAISPVLIDYSQEARAYSLLLLFFALIGLSLVAADRCADPHRRRWWLAGLAAVSTLALFTHLIAFPFVGLAMLWLRLGADREGAKLTPEEAWAVWIAVGVLGLVEVRRLFLYASDANEFGWLREPAVYEALTLLGGQWLPAAASVPWLAAFVVPAVAILMVLCWRQQIARDRVFLLLLAGWLAQPLVLWLVSITLQPVLMSRTLMPTWPAFALLLAFASERLLRRHAHIVRLAAVVLTATGLAISGTTRPKTDWNGIAQLLRSLNGEVLVCPFWRAPALLQAMEPEHRRIWVLYNSGAPALLDARSDGDWTAEFLFNANGRKDRDAQDRLKHLVLVRADCPEQEQVHLDQMIAGRVPARTVRINAPPSRDPLSPGVVDVVIEEYLPVED
ncbi:glycosyltransferase family 39 protein [Sphingomicrobium clamense]|uniref:Glycosyltransferase family 39 protein n=1 Tax=Sphingomicrobium clamense TaxID=2851013 RepID=A0ABS6V5P9_9SPHN|nr:glycosyltransferase family 39 protein [Sphingomicrobium sp. B8]MBW0144882.1 glycosyltransferase family 39 protein [Sphingomicrobium sp. B8]